MKGRRIFACISIAAVIGMLSFNTVFAENDFETGQVFYSGDGREKVIALTFDDGPHKYRTPEILDILKKYNVRATFFVVGEMAEASPDIIRRELAEGHEIGNHTFSHSKMRKMTPASLKNEIEKTEEAIFEISEYRPKLFRPPEGWCSDTIAKAAGALDYNIILWNIDTLDWAHNRVDKICTNIIENHKPGSIVLFHDYISGKSPTPEALENIIPKLLDEGYRFVTVSELLGEEADDGFEATAK